MVRSDYIVGLKSLWLFHGHSVACGSVAWTRCGVWVWCARTVGVVRKECGCAVWVCV